MRLKKRKKGGVGRDHEIHHDSDFNHHSPYGVVITTLLASTPQGVCHCVCVGVDDLLHVSFTCSQLASVT